MGKNDVAMAEVNKTPRKVNHFKVQNFLSIVTAHLLYESVFKFQVSHFNKFHSLQSWT